MFPQAPHGLYTIRHTYHRRTADPGGHPRADPLLSRDRLIASLYELMEQLALARFQRDKLPILEPLTGPLHLIQLQTRLLHEFTLIDLRRYEYASRLIAAIGRQHSGWLAQQRRPPSPRARRPEAPA